MRGEEPAVSRHDYECRITPAGAGRSSQTAFSDCCMQDHPRGCGEKDQISLNRIIKEGSPPRVRGEDISMQNPRLTVRITPAGAGRSCLKVHCHFLHKDHPRGCGEKRISMNGIRSESGSPPRVRGEGCSSSPNCPQSGITPAGAGRSPLIRIPVMIL